MTNLRLRAAAISLLAAAIGGAGAAAAALGRSESAVLGCTALVLLILTTIPVCCMLPAATWREKGRDFFQPGTTMALFAGVYIALPGWYLCAELDFQSNWAHRQFPAVPLVMKTFALALVALVAFGLGYRLCPVRSVAAPRAGTVSGQVLAARLLPIASVLLLVGAIFKVAHLSALGGLSGDVFLNLSPALREELDQRFGGVPYFLSTFFDWGALLLLFRWLLVRRGGALTAAACAVAMVLAFVLSGKRSAVLPFLFFPLIWYHYLRRPISVKLGIGLFLGGLALAAGLLFARILGPRVMVGGLSAVRDVAEVAESPVRFFMNSPELAIFDMTELVIQDRERLLHAAGGPIAGLMQYNFAPAAYVIPRAMWPDKPTFTDLGQVLYQSIIRGEENVGFSVGIIGGFYLFGGIIGTVLGLLLLGAGFRWMYQWFLTRRAAPTAVFNYAIAFWMCFQYIRFGTLGFAILFFLQSQLVGFVAMWVASRRWGLVPVEAVSLGGGAA